MAETVLSILARFKGEGAAAGVTDLGRKVKGLGQLAREASAEARVAFERMRSDALTASQALGSAYGGALASPGYVASVEEATAATEEMGLASQSLGAKMATMALPMAAGALSIYNLTSVLKSSVSGALDSEAAQQRLSIALGKSGKAGADSADNLADWADGVRRSTGESDEAIKSVLAFNAAIGKSPEEAKRITQAALDTAAALGKPFEEVNAAIIKSFGGMTRELGAFIPAIKSLSDEELRNGGAVDVLMGKYAGFAQMMGNTLPGQIRRNKEAWNEAKESFGTFVLAATDQKVSLIQQFHETWINNWKTLTFWLKEYNKEWDRVTGQTVQVNPGQAKSSGLVPVWQAPTTVNPFAPTAPGAPRQMVDNVDRAASEYNRAQHDAAAFFTAFAAAMPKDEAIRLARLYEDQGKSLADVNTYLKRRAESEKTAADAAAQVAKLALEDRLLMSDPSLQKPLADNFAVAMTPGDSQSDIAKRAERNLEAENQATEAAERLRELQEKHSLDAIRQADELGHAISYGLAQGIMQAKTMGDVLKSVMQSVMDSLLNRAADSAGDWIGKMLLSVGTSTLSGGGTKPESATGGSNRPSIRETTTPQSSSGVRTLVIPLMVGGREMARVLIPDLDQAYARGQAG